MRRLLGISLLLTVLILLARTADRPSSASIAQSPIPAAQDWLVRHQSEDGLWHAGRPDPCRVPTVFEVDEALTALAIVALDEGEPRRRGVQALIAAQRSDGAFGPLGAAKQRFNWILATWALAQLAPKEAATRKALKRVEAEALTRSLDDCEAGWALLAFEAARASLLPVRAGAEDAAKETLRAAVEAARHTTDVIPAMHARFGGAASVPSISASDDLHLLYFALPVRPVDAPDVVRYLLGSQATSGCARGSWPPDRWWGTAGGRVYATATAILILREAEKK